MNAKLAKQIEEMKKQTIGVEVEMNSISREKASRLAAEFFGTGRYADTASRNGYNTWSAWDSEGREWKFQKDVSIAGPDSEKCELVTPILTYKDIETLQELIRQLRHAGANSRTQGRLARRSIKKLHSALSCTQPNGKNSKNRKLQATAKRKSKIRNEDLAIKIRLHRRGIQNSERNPYQKTCRRHRIQERQSCLKDRKKIAFHRLDQPLRRSKWDPAKL